MVLSTDIVPKLLEKVLLVLSKKLTFKNIYCYTVYLKYIHRCDGQTDAVHGKYAVKPG